MKVSIITISYNSSKTIAKTLRSVLDQKTKSIEHIIIDGKSSDNTLEICKKFPHISKIISEKDKGVYDAFNKGLKFATGEIIGFLNSDDTFYNEGSLQNIINAFDPYTDCIYGNLEFINSNGLVVRKWKSKAFKIGAFKKAWMPAHPTFYCRKKIYDKLGGYKDTYKIAGDFELMLRFLEKHGVNSKFIDKKLVKMLHGGISNKDIYSKLLILKEEFKAFKENKIKFNKAHYLINKIFKIKEFL
ncbi:MAG: glycosyl transferase [Flavobacteriaceae bacterium]|nr:glycosyl transferase [Flavobacteriaceae bacterium]|tara:strand:- start:3102 stop:3833 length:732 start_codon:yes stop_codon:yes gene_type:complete